LKDLSIIIVTINNKKILSECLRSIYKSTRKITFEIIVSDNASTDGSQAMVRMDFPEVKLIENQENLGFSKANNLGLRAANAHYSMLLNDDTIIKDGALDTLVNFMNKTPKAGACGPKIFNTDGTLQHQGGLLSKKFWQSNIPTTVEFVIGAALLVRQEVINQVGLMDENLFFYNDDLDWCMSIRKARPGPNGTGAGWKIFFVPAAEIIHYGGFSSKKTFNHKLFIEGFRGGLYFCRKHYGEFAYNVYRCFLILFLILFLPFFILNPTKFFAHSDIIMLAARGQIPKPMVK